MEQQAILDRLLEEWEDGVLAGSPKSLESICRGNAELLAVLRKQVAKLVAIDGQLRIGLESDTIAAARSAAVELGDTVPKRLGGYELLSELGRGGMGIVYRAHQLAAGRIVALKVIRPDRLSSLVPKQRDHAIAQFRREALAAARLTHDHLVTVYDVGEADGHHYYSMHHIEGKSLADLLEPGPIASRDAAHYLVGVCGAVEEAHINGVIHRDIKPSNVLIAAKTGRAMIADFGIAKLAEGDRPLSETKRPFGSPPYMSPEQVCDSRSVTVATDIYSLGAVLYECLTGRPPFKADTFFATIKQVLDAEPAAPRVINPAVDRDAETIALKCLEKDPSRRYESAAALADDLRRYIRSEPIAARPISRPARVWRWCRRKPALASLAAVSLCLAIFMAAAGMVWAYREIGHAAELRENLAEANVLAARAEGQRGRWAESLELLDEAVGLGHPDPIAVELKRVESLDALGRTQERAALLEELMARPDLGKYRAQVLLWAADLARLEGESDRQREQIEQALELGLEKADAEYARALIAETTPKALEHLDAALRSDGFHYGAHRYQLFLLLLQGKLDDVEARAEAISALYPDDPQIEVLHAGALIADGRESDGHKLLDSLVAMNRLREDEAPVIAAAFGALREFREADLTDPTDVAKAVWLQALPILPRIHALQQDAAGGGPVSQAPQLLAMVPPSVSKAWKTVLSVMTAEVNPIASLFRKDHQAEIDSLTEAAAAHPEAFIQFMRAHLLDRDGRADEAEQAAIEASNAPSIAAHAKSAALSYAAAIAATHYINTKDETAIARAARHARARMDAGPVRSASEQPLMIKIALRAKDYELADRVVEEMRAHGAEETGWKNWQAQIALEQGHFAEARQHAKAVLEADSDNETASDLLKQATDGLRQLVSESGDNEAGQEAPTAAGSESG